MSRVTDAIALLYRMNGDDVETMTDQLFARRVTEYKAAVGQELRRYGCNAAVKEPSGADVIEMAAQSQTDAASIAKTYNTQLANEVKRLYTANPRGNRNYYYSNLEAWAVKRDRYKVPQIALNTAGTARNLAQTRFRNENNVAGRFLFAGPAPVCKICIRIRAMGLVDIEFVNSHPSPQHVGCPHEFVPARLSRIDCANVWAG